PALIAGLIPQATGPMPEDMNHALTERRELIEQRADAVLDTALTDTEPWTTALGTIPEAEKDAARWRAQARVVVAYRDRYGITATDPLGPEPESDAQKIDRARASVALRALTRQPTSDPQRPDVSRRIDAGRTM
ncbi:MobF family relaxase, partial [Brachybacterium tyrofermentans]